MAFNLNFNSGAATWAPGVDPEVGSRNGQRPGARVVDDLVGGPVEYRNASRKRLFHRVFRSLPESARTSWYTFDDAVRGSFVMNDEVEGAVTVYLHGVSLAPNWRSTEYGLDVELEFLEA